MALDLSLSLFTSAGILLSLAVLVTILRCITRIYVVKAFGIDDYFMIAAVILFAHYCAWVFYGRSLDRGKDTIEIPIEHISSALMAFYFAEISYILVACALKLSIGTFLLRIMRSKTELYIIYAILFFVICSSTVVFFKSIFQCQPISHFWDRLSPGICESDGETLAIAYFHSSVIASSDFAFTLMPIFVVWRLQMDRFTKISVCGLMALGAAAGVTTVLRIPCIKELISATNFLHATAELAILSSVEPGIGIIIGSVAATRPLFRLLFSKYHPFASLTEVQQPKASKASGDTTVIKGKYGNSSRANRQELKIGNPMPIPMERFDIERGDIWSGVRMVVEGGKVKNVGQNSSQVEGNCAKYGAKISTPSLHTMFGRSSEESPDAFRSGEQDSGERVIYKDVAVERVGEFLTKK